MKKRLFFSAFFLSAVLAGCSSRLPFGKKALAALSVSSVPQSEVFLNGESWGQTPIYEETLEAGEYTVLIKTDNQEWSGKVKLHPGVLTVVNRELNPDEASQSGEIITMEKGQGVAVISKPTQAEVKIDGNSQGVTPLVIGGVEPGDHAVVLKKEGFLERMVKVRVRDDYKLTINIQMATKKSPSPPPQAKEIPASPIPTAEPSGPYVIVKETGTSFGLHVRSGPGLGHPVVKDVKPGEKFPLLGEEKGWLNIRLSDGADGWASSRYLTRKE